MKMKNEIITFLFYKDYRKEVKELLRYGDYFYNKLKYVPSPFIHYEYDDFIAFLWNYLVIHYGDYGVCSIYGWVDNWKKAREFLEEIHSSYEQTRDDLGYE